MSRASPVAARARVAVTRAGGRDARTRVAVTRARASSAPSDAPSDALEALRDARVRRATDGAETTVPALVRGGETDVTVVTFLRSFG